MSDEVSGCLLPFDTQKERERNNNKKTPFTVIFRSYDIDFHFVFYVHFAVILLFIFIYMTANHQRTFSFPELKICLKSLKCLCFSSLSRSSRFFRLVRPFEREKRKKMCWKENKFQTIIPTDTLNISNCVIFSSFSLQFSIVQREHEKRR